MSDQQTPVCSMCGKPGFVTVRAAANSELPICLDHYVQLQTVENDRQKTLVDQTRHAMAMSNVAAAELDAIVGFSMTPRITIPEFAPAGAYTSINVTNSTIGVLSTAVVGQIISTIGSMPEGSAAREALADVTKAVAENPSLSEEGRKDLLDQIAIVAEQAATPTKDRKPAVVKSLLGTINQAAGSVTAVAGAWNAVEPILKAHFGF